MAAAVSSDRDPRAVRAVALYLQLARAAETVLRLEDTPGMLEREDIQAEYRAALNIMWERAEELLDLLGVIVEGQEEGHGRAQSNDNAA